jgi:hypothetical protein
MHSRSVQHTSSSTILPGLLSGFFHIHMLSFWAPLILYRAPRSGKDSLFLLILSLLVNHSHSILCFLVPIIDLY